MDKNKKYLLIFTAFSLLIHFVSLTISLGDIWQVDQEISSLKIRSIRHVGEDDGIDSKQIYLPTKEPNPPVNKISAKQLAPQFDPVEEKSLIQKKFQEAHNSSRKFDPEGLKPQKAIKALSLSNKNITGFLKDSPNSNSARQYLNSFENTDSLVKLEVPKGIKESELNEHELVFYSFQKRTAQTYINSFHKKLNEFKIKNPHLNFPVTTKKEKMTGRVIYDKDGNIVKINMIKWTKTQKLQDFFLDVLKEMTALPNPPEAIVKNGEFTIFFSLTVNS